MLLAHYDHTLDVNNYGITFIYSTCNCLFFPSSLQFFLILQMRGLVRHIFGIMYYWPHSSQTFSIIIYHTTHVLMAIFQVNSG